MSDRRAEIREGLHPLYTPFFDALCALLGPEWQPYCGFRTKEDQARMKAIGASKAGAWESPHCYGLASDWFKPGWGEKWPHAGDPEWQAYVDACQKVGARAGATFASFPDFPHNEYKISIRWEKVKDVYNQFGLEAALEFARQAHV